MWKALKIKLLVWAVVWGVKFLDQKDYLYEIGVKLIDESENFFKDKYPYEMPPIIANCLLDMIRGVFYSSPNGMNAFSEWLTEKEKKYAKKET